MQLPILKENDVSIKTLAMPAGHPIPNVSQPKSAANPSRTIMVQLNERYKIESTAFTATPNRFQPPVSAKWQRRL